MEVLTLKSVSSVFVFTFHKSYYNDVCLQEITLESGSRCRYNKLCICTGGQPKVTNYDSILLLPDYLCLSIAYPVEVGKHSWKKLKIK